MKIRLSKRFVQLTASDPKASPINSFRAKAIAKTPILAVSKSTAQRSTTQQRRHIKSTKHVSLVGTVTGIIRKYIALPPDLAVADASLARKKSFVHSGERNLTTDKGLATLN